MPEDIESLLRRGSKNGALGAITLFSEVFDLYLLTRYSKLNNGEILRWLKAGDVDHCFRSITTVDENLTNFYLQKNISITITSDNKIVDATKNVSTTYWLEDVHTTDIQNGIQKVNSWRDIVRDITKYSTVENYDYRHNKK